MTFDSSQFRRVLGHYPTGVCAVTTTIGDTPVGMVVGTFTSVSLDPPLVAFFPDKSSRSWSKIEQAGHFCVSVLADHHTAVCRDLASKANNKFENISYRHSPNGFPIVDESVAWIECSLHRVYEAGDHFIVLGEVQALGAEPDYNPLLFYRSGYGQFAPFAQVG